jgi:hypothetical protein
MGIKKNIDKTPKMCYTGLLIRSDRSLVNQQGVRMTQKEMSKLGVLIFVWKLIFIVSLVVSVNCV